jgi:hypothetical protein
MTRSLTDAAIVLSVIAGKDPNDNFTLAQPPVVPDFTKALNKNALKGKRIGVPRRVFLNDSITGNDPSINVAYEKALLTIKALGATVVDPADLPSADEFVTSNNETIVLNVVSRYGSATCSFARILAYVFIQVQLNEYFAALLENPSGVRTLADLIKFDDDNPTLEEPAGFEDQSQCVLLVLDYRTLSQSLFHVGLSRPRRQMVSTQNTSLLLRPTTILEVRRVSILFSKSSILMHSFCPLLGSRPVQQVFNYF